MIRHGSPDDSSAHDEDIDVIGKIRKSIARFLFWGFVSAIVGCSTKLTLELLMKAT